MQINSRNDLRSAVTLLTAHANNMCNAETTSKLVSEFVESKDILIELYKFLSANLETT